MPLDDFLKDKGTRKGKEGKPVPPDIPVDGPKPPVDRMDPAKIELLKKLLAEKNLLKPEPNARARPKDAATSIKPTSSEFLEATERFAEWLRGRMYVRGDIDTVKQMITGLVALDPTLVPGSRDDIQERFPDLAAFLRAAKEHDSLHPGNEVLTKQEFMALTKKKQKKPLASTDYRHLKLLKDKVKDAMRKVPLYKFLNDFLDLP